MQPNGAERRTVFVVDDEALIADTLALILNQSGWNATAVYNGQQAVQAAAERGSQSSPSATLDVKGRLSPLPATSAPESVLELVSAALYPPLRCHQLALFK